MIVTVHPSNISGTIQAPTSKSSMQRACAAALLADKETIISNPGASNDDLAAKDVIQNLGATITERSNGDLLITPSNLVVTSISPSGGQGVSGSMNCGEAGLGIRMFAPIAALNKNEITINGTGSLLTRPMNFFDEIFPQLGIKIQSNGGKLPIKIQGPLQPKNITIDGSLSSQFLTGLLFAYGKSATAPVTITVNNLKSKPYIDLTLQVMKHFGYDVVNNNYESFLINPKPLNPKPINYTVEGDWSGAAFLLVMGAVAGEITIKGLDVFSTQADKAILQALNMSKAKLSIEEKQIVVGPGKLQAFHFDATECPDLFPPLVALASYCEGTTVIEGVKRLEHKESNRGLTLQEEFGKMGVTIKLQDDLMLIEGGQGVKGATVHSHHDHRIAMACAVAGLKATGDTIIEEAEAINKSYPDFYEHLKLLGASVSAPAKQLN
ncbi:MAG TPA: 3-phosphoshikimate 1-carboxyvinyltransferase [Ferruginibacter sp.]|jgi:3-phosphoshikimate 1-carboxyvinyltransferase|nr:3-phosphoshikimate 1-carboxyvinyltransferase [Ferruginibacter sp.]